MELILAYNLAVTDCIFCKIVAGEIPSHKIYEDDKTFAFLDIRANNPGHTLVVPKEHHRNIFDLPPELIQAVGESSQRIAKALTDSGLAEGINVISNNEKAAGQLVFHSHTHVIPRLENDGFKHWPGKEYEPGEAESVAEKIKNAL